jgi:ribosomal protein S18 acetylase RimI-like enzyme
VLEIRDATPADAPDIATVHVESWRAAYRGLLPDEVLDGLSVPDRARWWRETLAVANGRATLLAVEDGTVLGFAAFGRVLEGNPREDDQQVGQLYALYLRPSAWGRGVGSTLHAAAMARLHEAGYTRVGLWRLAGNDRAQRFYQRHGWFDDGRAQLVAGADGERQDHRGMSRMWTTP